MTTPADWKTFVTHIKDLDAVEMVDRVVQFNIEWLQTQLGHLEELHAALARQAKMLSAKGNKAAK
ncbi:MAG: hypothetical protein AB1746_12835 [Candidatus Zixiibacteriota bacterium]